MWRAFMLFKQVHYLNLKNIINILKNIMNL
jgi:hypothetical protein